MANARILAPKHLVLLQEAGIRWHHLSALIWSRGLGNYSKDVGKSYKTFSSQVDTDRVSLRSLKCSRVPDALGGHNGIAVCPRRQLRKELASWVFWGIVMFPITLADEDQDETSRVLVLGLGYTSLRQG
jgi:hypothetical protein